MSYPSNSPTRPYHTAGFTLMEMLVVIAVMGTAGIALSGLIQAFYRNNAFLLEQSAALESARTGVRDAVTAIREASYGDDGSYPIQNAATSTFTIYSDFDQDSSVERVRYTLINDTLYRAVINSGGSPPGYTGQAVSTSTVATNVRNGTLPVFMYYDISGVALSATSTDESRVASVGIMLIVDLNPARAPNVYRLEEKATLRNLRATE